MHLLYDRPAARPPAKTACNGRHFMRVLSLAKLAQIQQNPGTVFSPVFHLVSASRALQLPQRNANPKGSHGLNPKILFSQDAAMRRAVFAAFLLAALVALTGCSRPGHHVPPAWIPAGNEMEDIVDAETGRTVRFLTKGGSVDTIFHYHNTSWGEILGRQYLFFESSVIARRARVRRCPASGR
jgi:hypothetical protein